MHNVAVFPLNRSFLPFMQPWSKNSINSSHLYKLYSLHSELSDISEIDKRPPMNYQSYLFDVNQLDSIDTLLIPEGSYAPQVLDKIIQVIELCACHKKSIICCAELDDNVLDMLRKRCAGHGVDFQHYSDICSENKRKVDEKIEQLYNDTPIKPGIPIVLVGELMPDINGKDITVSVQSLLRHSGYAVSGVSQPGFGQVTGMHGWDEIFPKQQLKPEDTIAYISEYFNALEALENPDIIIAHIPQGLMAMNDNLTNAYGIYAYMLFQALHPDYFVCCMPYDQYASDALVKYNNLFAHRFGHPADCFHLSNVSLDISSDVVQTHYLNQDHVDKHLASVQIDNENFIAINGLSREGANKLCDDILCKLTQYAGYTSVF